MATINTNREQSKKLNHCCHSRYFFLSQIKISTSFGTSRPRLLFSLHQTTQFAGVCTTQVAEADARAHKMCCCCEFCCARACICGIALYDLLYFIGVIIVWPFTLLVSLVGCVVWVVLWPFRFMSLSCAIAQRTVKKKMIKMPKKWCKKIKKRGKKSTKSSRKSVSPIPV